MFDVMCTEPYAGVAEDGVSDDVGGAQVANYPKCG
jgi:hypothetical protein